MRLILYRSLFALQRRARRVQIMAFVLIGVGALLPDAAFAQNVFSGATTAATNMLGNGLNVLLGIVTALGGVGIGTGLIGHFKDPEKKKMWDRVFELSLIPLVGGAIALGYFNNAASLTSALGSANTGGGAP